MVHAALLRKALSAVPPAVGWEAKVLLILWVWGEPVGGGWLSLGPAVSLGCPALRSCCPAPARGRSGHIAGLSQASGTWPSELVPASYPCTLPCPSGPGTPGATLSICFFVLHWDNGLEPSRAVAASGFREGR